MLRRYWIRSETDQRVVRWSLVLAAFAFAAGSFAETKLERHVQDNAVQEVVHEAKAQSAGTINPAG
jgi:hypothetical protein